MQILRTVPELRQWSRHQRAAAQTIALVPTMGALHAGHASLIRAAAASCTQSRRQHLRQPHPVRPQRGLRPLSPHLCRRLRLAEAEGAHIVFAPTVEELYPPGASTFVEVEILSQRLDGKSRPTHFRGVATVVAKLLIAAEPDRAYFGQKDAAQVAVLRRMVADLRFATEIVVCPIVREPDGLALSSRNLYLTPAQRTQALTLSRAIRKVESLAASNERRAIKLIEAAHQIFAAEPAIRIDYIELVDWSTLSGTLFAP
jgi:pantoate--beta-alanine ligase